MNQPRMRSKHTVIVQRDLIRELLPIACLIALLILMSGNALKLWYPLSYPSHKKEHILRGNRSEIDNMRWIEKNRHERKAEVTQLTERLLLESPDRFWISSDQDGELTQEMNILLPAGEDLYYDINVVTCQLAAARLAALSMGQMPGERIAFTPSLLDKISLFKHEIFEISHDHDKGLKLTIAINVPGLTHEVVDAVLIRFLDGSQVPLRTYEVHPSTLKERIIDARDKGLHSYYIV